MSVDRPQALSDSLISCATFLKVGCQMESKQGELANKLGFALIRAQTERIRPADGPEEMSSQRASSVAQGAPSPFMCTA